MKSCVVIAIAIAGLALAFGMPAATAQSSPSTTPVVDCTDGQGHLIAANPDGSCPQSTSRTDTLTSSEGTKAANSNGSCSRRSDGTMMCVSGPDHPQGWQPPPPLVVTQGETLTLFLGYSPHQPTGFTVNVYRIDKNEPPRAVDVPQANPSSFQAVNPTFPTGDDNVAVHVNLPDGSNYDEYFNIKVQCAPPPKGATSGGPTPDGGCAWLAPPAHLANPGTTPSLTVAPVRPPVSPTVGSAITTTTATFVLPGTTTTTAVQVLGRTFIRPKKTSSTRGLPASWIALAIVMAAGVGTAGSVLYRRRSAA